MTVVSVTYRLWFYVRHPQQIYTERCILGLLYCSEYESLLLFCIRLNDSHVNHQYAADP